MCSCIPVSASPPGEGSACCSPAKCFWAVLLVFLSVKTLCVDLVSVFSPLLLLLLLLLLPPPLPLLCYVAHLVEKIEDVVCWSLRENFSRVSELGELGDWCCLLAYCQYPGRGHPRHASWGEVSEDGGDQAPAPYDHDNPDGSRLCLSTDVASTGSVGTQPCKRRSHLEQWVGTNMKSPLQVSRFGVAQLPSEN